MARSFAPPPPPPPPPPQSNQTPSRVMYSHAASPAEGHHSQQRPRFPASHPPPPHHLGFRPQDAPAAVSYNQSLGPPGAPRALAYTSPAGFRGTRVTTRRAETPKGPPICTCKKSQCLKLYCECFSAERYCVDCKCSNCLNVPAYDDERERAILELCHKNPSAFKPRNSATTQNQMCRCKKSECLKKVRPLANVKHMFCWALPSIPHEPRIMFIAISTANASMLELCAPRDANAITARTLQDRRS
jgi:hypothetical protein